jgi:hypothetical protein
MIERVRVGGRLDLVPTTSRDRSCSVKAETHF